jgi:hypothetical protein
MKKFLSIVAIGMVLTACSSAPPKPEGNSYAAQVSNQQAAIMQAPEWMSKLPKSPNAVYENGTATSSDFGMADMKAKTMAYSKICTSAGGTLRSQMKMYKADSGDTSMENTELTVRSMCPDVDITGVEVVEMKHVAEGSRIRTYVLVALPTGSSNVLKTTKDMQKRAPEAFKELDRIVDKTPEPQSKVEGITLMPVDNEEYKQKRDTALQKPGAVLGQTVVR